MFYQNRGEYSMFGGAFPAPKGVALTNYAKSIGEFERFAVDLLNRVFFRHGWQL